MKDYYVINSTTLGRHCDLVEDPSDSEWVDESTCTRAVTKQVLIEQGEPNADLIVRIECDGCGTVIAGRHRPGAIIEELDDE